MLTLNFRKCIWNHAVCYQSPFTRNPGLLSHAMQANFKDFDRSKILPNVNATYVKMSDAHIKISKFIFVFPPRNGF